MTARADSTLSVSHVAGRSVVSAAEARSPLKLLTPKNHGHGAWVFQSSYGGGFVGADHIALEVAVEEGATLFLSSQASSKVYRKSRSRYELAAKVRAGATLISWPDPVVCFDGASLDQSQHFALEQGARLICVDAYSAGRVAREERWAFDRLAAKLSVEVEGRRVFTDALLLSNQHGPLPERLRGVDVLGTIVIAESPAPPTADGRPSTVSDAVHAQLHSTPLRPFFESTQLVSSRWPWGLVVRCAAPSMEAFVAATRGLLRAHVSGLLGDDPHQRKW